LKKNEIVSVDQITPTTIRTYLTEKVETGDMPNTNHARYRAIKTFLRWLENEELLLRNPINKVSPPKVPQTLLPPLTDDELDNVIKSLEKQKGNLAIRNLALFYFLLDSGLRVEECSIMKLGQINPDGSFIITGKGKKQRVVRVSPTTLRYIGRYLNIRGGQDGSPLWVGVRGPMTLNGLMETIEKIGKKARVHLSAHEIRRTFAVKSLRNGCNIRSLQMLLGHASITTTIRYLALADDYILEEAAASSPVEHLQIERLKR
jgi:site-specific recombinase XerD